MFAMALNPVMHLRPMFHSPAAFLFFLRAFVGKELCAGMSQM